MKHRGLIFWLAAPLLAALVAATPAAAHAKSAVKPPQQAMIAAADPRAVEAGLRMLRQGGSATDAAIAVIAVLGLVEPQSAGVGGGGVMVEYDSARKRTTAYDGREAAPAAATAEYFFAGGKPLPFPYAVVSGLSTGAPSLYAMLKLAHDDHGKLPWAKLFEPAIELAEQGFVVSPRLHNSIAQMASRGALKADAAARAYLFTEDGQPLPIGFVRKNPDYAATLRALAANGPKALQEGAIAAEIVKAVHRDPRPGLLSEADLKAVKPQRLEAVCGGYRAYRICGMPPPSSGGVAVQEILNIFQRLRPAPVGPLNVDDWAGFLWASRLAYADRDYYVADDTIVPVPTKGLIAPRFAAARAKLADLGKAAPAFVAPGDPSLVTGGPSLLGRWGMPSGMPEGGTTHISIVDQKGDAVALTATIEAPFGSERMAAGFFLNNQLTDFSINPVLNGKPVANAPAAGKKPRSSMAPTLIFDRNGRLYAAIGSPGGSAIIAYVAKTIIGVVDWNLSMQDAIDLPNVVAAGGVVSTEKERFPAALSDALAARGWAVRQSSGEISGLNGFVIRKTGLEGGSDPRREGEARTLSAAAAR